MIYQIKKQNGIALITAILVVALVTIASVTMITNRELQTSRTTHLFYRDQAYQYVLGIESWAMSVLFQDYVNNRKDDLLYDSYQDLWNTSLTGLEVEQARLGGRIYDLQGRMNLNNLVSDGKVQQQWVDVYAQLLAHLALPESLVETLLDWLDENELPVGANGAEDDYYLRLDQPYRAANQPMASLSELGLIKGYSAEYIEKLKPFIFVTGQQTKVNINTANTIVLQSLVPSLSETDVTVLTDLVKSTPFKTMDELKNHELFREKEINFDLLSVDSELFVVNGEAQIDDYEVTLQSVIKRDILGNIRVIKRLEGREF